MTEKRIYRLVHAESRRRAAEDCMRAPDGWIVKVSEPNRTLEQNAKLHAILQDISGQIEYHGKRREIEFWKGLFVSGWQIAVGERPEIVPGLEGEFINIRESTTTLSSRRMSSLIEYIQAWGTDAGVLWSDICAN